MKFAAVVLFCYFPFSYSVTHTLQYFYTATSGIQDFPDFVSVGVVDGVPITYYDSMIEKGIPRQSWMAQMDLDYWDSETVVAIRNHRTFKADIKILKSRFNQTGGMHVLQKSYGCQWDVESGATDGHEMFGYDGEDFLALDLKNMRWIATVPQAVQSQAKWDRPDVFFENRKMYFRETCVEWLKKYLDYGSSTLGRTVRPEVSLLQMDSSSSVVCHATGFYPEEVMITWKRGGVEIQNDVVVGETLPNMDGTFQKRAVLTVSPEQRKKSQYTCEVAHKSGMPIVKTLVEDGNTLHFIIIGCGVAAALVLIGVIAAVVVRKKTGYKKAKESDCSSDCSSKPSDC